MERNYSSERGRVPLNLTTVRRLRWGTFGPSPQLLTKPSVLLARGMGCPQVWRPCSEVRSRAPGEGVLWLCQGIVLSLWKVRVAGRHCSLILLFVYDFYFGCHILSTFCIYKKIHILELHSNQNTSSMQNLEEQWNRYSKSSCL